MQNEKVLIVLSFIAIYFVWGSTYLANYFAIASIPPFLMSGSRFLTAGLLLYSYGRLRGNLPPNWEEIKTGLISGFLLLSIGTGSIVYSEQYIDTGLVALLVAFQPLIIVLMMWVWKKRRPGIKVIFGLILGIVGMILLIGQEQILDSESSAVGLIAVFIALLSWSIGVILLNGWPRPASANIHVGVQMIGAGFWLFIISWITGDFRLFDWQEITTKALMSWFYLVVFGSIIAFSAFNYLLKRITPDKVATSNYVNPVVALLLGTFFNEETISGQSILAAVVLVSGVFFINANFKLKRPPLNQWNKITRGRFGGKP
ncbi:MAG: EamA family transporter [Saprospiraceae bacterium]